MSLDDAVRSVLADTLNLPPEFLDYTRQYAALNPISTARTSGTRIALGTKTAAVATAGVTFGAGADILSSALPFTADGKTSYIARVAATEWTNTIAGAITLMSLNLDGADAGIMALLLEPVAGYSMPCTGALYFTPSSGSHTANVRIVVNSGTGTVQGGVGGAGTRGPIIVTLEVA